MKKKLKKGSFVKVTAKIGYSYFNQEVGEIWRVVGYNHYMGDKTYKLDRPSPTHTGLFQSTHWLIKDVDEMLDSGILEIC